MTPQEYDAIGAVRTDVSALRSEIHGGLTEIRGLIEARRLEDTAAHAKMDEKVETVRRDVDVRLRLVEQTSHTTRVLAASGLLIFGTIVGGVLYLVH